MCSKSDGSVALVVTSCGRMDLLESTLRSFERFNTYPLKQVIIVEDGGLSLNSAVIAKWLDVSEKNVTILINDQNIGQIASIDRAYKEVKSEYIFHCEDDWAFTKPSFIEHSLEVLASDSCIFCVWLRALNDLNGHPYEDHIVKVGELLTEYSMLAPDFKGVWCGFTLNPSLRRTADAMMLHPYANQEKLTKGLGNRTRVTESDLSIAYGKLGFRGAVLRQPQGCVEHIGTDRHIASEWESSWIVSLKNLARRLVRKISAV